MIREAFRAGQAPGVYETAEVIGEEDALSFFSGGPFEDEGEDFLIGDGDAPVVETRPALRPSPPSGDTDGDLESGGLY